MGRRIAQAYSRTMTAAALIFLVIKVSLALTVLVTGMRAGPGDHLWLFRRPSLLAQMLLAMNVMMPLIAVLVVSILRLDPAVKVALVALSISPVPPLLSKKVTKSRGASSYLVGLLFTVSALSIVLVPAAAWAIGRLFATPVHVESRAVLSLVGEVILLPLLAGALLHRFAPRFVARAIEPTDKAATLLLVVAVIPVLVISWPAIRELLGNGTLLAMLIMCFAGLAIGYYVGGPEEDNRVVLALATAMRHPAVAITIGQAAFPGNELIRSAVLMAVVVTGVATLPFVSWAERRQWDRRRHSMRLSGRRSTLPRPAYHGPERRANSARGGDRRQ
jgi:BASS family bile acid:Na+ symporter